MRKNTIFGLGLAVVAVLVQAGCNQDKGPSQSAATPEKTGGAPSSSARSGDTRNREARKDGAVVSDAPSRGGDMIPVEAPRAYTVTLPEGTALAVRTTTPLSTKTQMAGQDFTAHLEQPLVFEGRTVVPKGAEVVGMIVDADKGGRVKERASLAVRLTRLHTTGGDVEMTTNTITREAKATTSKDAVKVGIGSGVGAAIGAIAGGGRGAAIGAAAGAGAGAGVVLATHGDPAVIPSETVLHFTLTAPLTVAEPR